MGRLTSVMAALLLLPVAIGAVWATGSNASEPQPAAAEAEQATRADYRCLGRSPAEVVLLVGETATRLPQQRSADGARYAAAEQSFWIKGDQARWQLRQAPPLRCVPRRP
jgi:membrane-bound inhibitor of C-type lysozyme